MAVVVVIVLLFGGVFAWRFLADRQSAAAGTPLAIGPDPGSARVGYVVTGGNAMLSESVGGPGRAIAPGIVFPVTATGSVGFQVFDNCNRPGWVAADGVEPGLVPVERERGLEESVFVIDPGHGLPDLGAVGPSGLTETEVNIDVSARIVDLLRSPHDIEWATGAVTPGTTVPPVAAAILTRAPDGPNGGDYELGLTFRAMLGNAVEATALVSIHHNTEPIRSLDHPGSSAFVSAANPESPRLGGLIVDELRTAFSRFDAEWVGGRGEGLSIRVGADGDDYYTLLALSKHPAVIVEGAYLSNPSEEALIMTDVFRQAYAEGVYRALVRFVTTDDDPIPAPEPELFDVEAPPRSMNDCVVPAP
ncbi:MAG TPA: N-acetylmuramoyl-L-alanine amidase [Acidimicrobiia bacterium]|nr:N-acetylmuramoyl-L-alanine amidase [Acidimicrobiia bacterium]